MSKPRKQPPVRSFGPELMAALLRGATSEFTIRMPYNRAVRFRSRIYQLRSSMRSEGHPEYDLVSRVKVTITWPSGTSVISDRGGDRPALRSADVTVNIAPHDSEFASDLEKAGIDLKGPASKPLHNPREFTSIDDLLSSIKEDLK